MVTCSMFLLADSLLTAQSFPNLNHSNTANTAAATSAQRQANLLSLSQTMALSLTNSSDSETDFLETCHAQVRITPAYDSEPLVGVRLMQRGFCGV